MPGHDPVLYLRNPPGTDGKSRRALLDKLGELNQLQYDEFSDPEITAKVQQYEMAYRMQTSVPEVTDLSGEPDHIIKLHGPACLVHGTYAPHARPAANLGEN